MKKWALVCVLGLGFITGWPLPPASAAALAPNQPAGITLAPFLQTISVASFEPTKSVNLVVSNHTQVTRNFKVSITDFGAQGEFGGVAFLGLSNGNSPSRFGLARSMSVSQSDFSLAANASTTLLITVHNDENLTPGGHYGAVLVNESTGSSQPSANRVGANPTVSSLIFVTKLGGEQYDLRLNSVSHDTSWRHLPQVAHLRFYNPGNVAVVPRGTVRLLGPHNSLIGQGAINEDSSFILPDAYRQLGVPIKLVGAAPWWPAHYTLQVNYRYDGLAQTARHEEKLYFVNWPHLGFSIVIIIGLAIMLYYFRLTLWTTLKKVRFHP
ncbi:MAG: hypothetical protein ABI602_04510 [Candidatus Saccharibacteria bacterium]